MYNNQDLAGQNQDWVWVVLITKIYSCVNWKFKALDNNLAYDMLEMQYATSNQQN